jgi:hypothetical protein
MDSIIDVIYAIVACVSFLFIVNYLQQLGQYFNMTCRNKRYIAAKDIVKKGKFLYKKNCYAYTDCGYMKIIFTDKRKDVDLEYISKEFVNWHDYLVSKYAYVGFNDTDIARLEGLANIVNESDRDTLLDKKGDKISPHDIIVNDMIKPMKKIRSNYNLIKKMEADRNYIIVNLSIFIIVFLACFVLLLNK